MDGFDYMQWLVAALVFAAMGLLVLGLGAWTAAGRQDVSRRLGTATQAEAAGPMAGGGEGGFFHRLIVKRLTGVLVSEQDVEREAIRLRLIRAGLYSPQALSTFYVARLLLGGLTPVLGVPAVTSVYTHLGVQAVTMLTLGLAALGYLAPAVFLDRRIAHRQRAVREGFPDALDLMVVCVEAGLGVEAAVARVAREIGSAHPLLAEHLGMLSVEMRAGRTREESWRNMALRIGLPEINSLVALMIQSETLGSSSAEALRTHAAELRMRRMLAAEAKAQQLAVKMTFPLILLILPALMIVIAAPAMIRGYRILMPAMGGGH